ncbi:MAG: LacI family DNA-binding transcriptional regulator [Opitutaceae bacterium]|jgi:LacI family transcriptional regulator/LacI family repressor for deo operon, udp, cdd, tsx, nupC, and nupG|nr:LacI family DNA-binding transcriptional regulator [Opitutaceae bacterium]
MENRRVTQLDVARKAGVHRATVSMAFRNHPNLPARTRERIRRIAERMGYVPDPMLAALAAYRSRIRPAGYQGVIAWVVNSAYAFDWRERPHFVDYFEGATTRARRHGFKVEIVDLNLPQTRLERVASILKARNVTGVLLCPQPRPETVLPFPWRDFSAVTFGYTLTDPQLHTVTATHYRATLQTMRNLQRLGYKRIGLVLHDVHDRRTDHNYLAGYLVGQHLGGAKTKIPPLEADYGDTAAVSRWLRRHRPDAVVTGSYQFLNTLRLLDVRVPLDLGVACPVLPSDRTDCSGMVENNVRAGAVAVDFLVSMIQRGERGVPESAERIHVECRWHAGKSVRTVGSP